MISQVIYMTLSPSFFDVTMFLLSSVVIDPSILTNTLQNIAAGWKKIDLVFYFLLFSNIGSVFHCFQSPENVLNFEQISETENSFNYSVAKYFHHTNINHIAIMSFIKVKSLDNSFNAILFESNIWLILICNGITRWRQSTMIFTEHYFRKKELMMGFFIKICNKFVILNKRQNARKCFVI